MRTEEIQKFISTNKLTEKNSLKVTFKKRNAIHGMFVDCKDASDLKSKNFWRIVPTTNFEAWQKSKDLNLSRIFSGSDFVKLSVE